MEGGAGVAKCPKCGVENHQGASVCASCGGDMSASVRYCVSCGRSIDFGANVCPYCGHDFRAAPAAPAAASLSTGMKVLLYLASIFVWIAGVIIGIVFMAKDDPEYKRVGKICLILGIVSILLSVGLAAALYVMVLGFSGGEVTTPLTTVYSTRVLDGVKFSFMAVTADEVRWSDVTFVVNDGNGGVSWHVASEDLTGVGVMVENYASETLGTLEVSLTVTDIAGNGYLNGGDYFVLTSSPSFSATTDYTVVLVYEPTDGSMCSASFSG